MRLRRLPSAIADVDELWLYIAQHDRAAADRMVDDLNTMIDKLLDFPLMGRARPDLHPLVRSVPVKPYVVAYRVNDNTIVIIRVFHAARDVAALNFDTDS